MRRRPAGRLRLDVDCFCATGSVCSAKETMATGAWYFDDPKMPTKVVLCPQTCERVSAAADGKMAVAFGCKRTTSSNGGAC